MPTVASSGCGGTVASRANNSEPAVRLMAFSLGPLGRHRDFVHLWGAQSVSAFGSRITRTALPVIAILLVTADPVQIAVLGALTVIPGVLVGLFAGGFIDRHAKRPVLVWCDVVRAALVLSIPIAAWTAHLGIAQLYMVAALRRAVFRRCSVLPTTRICRC